MARSSGRCAGHFNMSKPKAIAVSRKGSFAERQVAPPSPTTMYQAFFFPNRASVASYACTTSGLPSAAASNRLDSTAASALLPN